MAKEFYQPVFVSAVPVAGQVELRAVNDTGSPVVLTVTAHAAAMDGTTRELGKANVTVGDRAELALSVAVPEGEILAYTWAADGHQGGDHFAPKPYKSYDLQPTFVTYDAKKVGQSYEITLKADALALFVAIESDQPGRFSANGFALFPGHPATVTFTPKSSGPAPQFTLRDGLKKTSYAISTDETRYVLNGIFTSFHDGKMTLVATDGRRLAMVDSDLEVTASHETDVIIPSKAVQELQRLLGESGDVIVKLSDSQISFAIGDSLLCSKLIEGNYPNYRQVIPGDSNERVVISREALLETVRRVSLLSSEKSNSVKLVFSENRIEVTANSPDVGEAQESMDVIYQGPPMQIAFNPEFLQAPLRALDSDDVYLDLIDEMSPGVLRIEGTFLYVLMPMRVTN